MNIKFTIIPANIINFILGVVIIVIGLNLLGIKSAEDIGGMCQQILGLICIGYGSTFKLFKGE